MAKEHSTNYYNAFIEVSQDTKARQSSRPLPRGGKATLAEIQFGILSERPYQLTSDELLFEAFARRGELPKEAYAREREKFFSKGQPCLRTSPLVKTYGFGIHFNGKGQVALIGMESPEYQRLLADPSLKKLKGMRSRRDNVHKLKMNKNDA